MIACSKTKEITENKTVETFQNPTEKPLVEINPNADFSEFKHLNPQHERLPCSLCHIRQDNSATPKLPGHLPCSGCHTQQFADSKNAICTICHTNTENGEMKRFPALRSFNVSFDHANHLRQANCATCHKPARNGVAFSIPSRTSAHLTCFQCHKPDAQSDDKNIGSCETCHQIGKTPNPVSDWSKAFTLSFSHTKHNLNCTSCHNIKAGTSRGNQVTAPIAAMHFAPKNTQSCASCHNNKRAFGGNDFSDCKRCHRGNNFEFR